MSARGTVKEIAEAVSGCVTVPPGHGRERPIRFRDSEIRAILNGQKTQERRVMADQISSSGLLQIARPGYCEIVNKHGARIPGFYCPHGQPGDRLWVRETWCLTRDTLDYETGGSASSYEWSEDDYGDARPYLGGNARFGLRAALHYPADGEDETPSEMWPCIGVNGRIFRKKEIRWRNAIHMPRWASRILLEITDIRAQRLQEISEADARAEGVRAGDMPDRPQCDCDGEDCVACSHYPSLHKPAFRHLWNSRHGANAWDVNPWVWAISFKRITP